MRKKKQLTKEQIALRKRWTRALRYGKYKRAIEALRVDGRMISRFCCLGVLCDVVDPRGWSSSKHPLSARGREALSMVGLGLVGLSNEQQNTLMDMNDGAGQARSASFAQIAAQIDVWTAEQT